MHTRNDGAGSVWVRRFKENKVVASILWFAHKNVVMLIAFAAAVTSATVTDTLRSASYHSSRQFSIVAPT